VRYDIYIYIYMLLGGKGLIGTAAAIMLVAAAVKINC
jgi:hypothetical protein